MGFTSTNRADWLVSRTYPAVVKFEFTVQLDRGTTGCVNTAVRLVNSVVKLNGKITFLLMPSFSACLLESRILLLADRRPLKSSWLPVFQLVKLPKVFG